MNATDHIRRYLYESYAAGEAGTPDPLGGRLRHPMAPLPAAPPDAIVLPVDRLPGAPRRSAGGGAVLAGIEARACGRLPVRFGHLIGAFGGVEHRGTPPAI